MRRTNIVAVIGLAVVALALAGCGGGSNGATSTTTETGTTTGTTGATSGNTLTGNVGPGFEISLKDASGNDVTTLTAGEYTINVDDQSDIHNFHLTGPGVDEMTEVSTTGMVTWHVTLEAGSYHFQCDPHSSSMNGDFEVTS
jgi:type 1 fimbria pilin